MNDQALRFRLGIFVLGMLILLAVLVVLFGGFPSLLTSVDHYTLVFDNASGVGPGTPVRRSGVRVGEVESVSLDNQTGQVQVGIKVESGFIIRKSDQPTIVRGLLGSDSSIDFVPRKPAPPQQPDPTPVEPGAILPGVAQTDAGDFLQQTTELLRPTQETLADLRRTLTRFEKTANMMEDTLREYRDLGQQARGLPAELKKSSEQFRKLAQSLDEAVPDLRKLAQDTDAAVPDVRRLVNSINDMTPQLKRTAEWVERTASDWSKVGERVNLFLRENDAKMSATIEQLNKMVSDQNQQRLSRILANLETGTKQVNNVLTDDNVRRMKEIVANVERSSRQLDGLMQESRVAMKQFGVTMTRADSVMQDVQKVTEPFGKRSSGILKNLDDASLNLNEAITEVRELMKHIARSDGTVQRLLYDPALYNNIEQAVCGMNRLLPRFDRILRDVEIFSDKIARRPETLGLGGVFSPGSGLKESPSTLTPGPYLPPWKYQQQFQPVQP